MFWLPYRSISTPAAADWMSGCRSPEEYAAVSVKVHEMNQDNSASFAFSVTSFFFTAKITTFQNIRALKAK